MRDFRQVKAWQRSHALTLEVYGATSAFPREEMYGLTSQIRRSCSSIPANIAEDCGRHGDAELARFLHIAFGSASELEYHLLLAHDLGFLPKTEYEHLTDSVTEVKKMLSGFLARLKADR